MDDATQRGTNEAPPVRPGPRVRDVLAGDAVPPPPQLLVESSADLGDRPIDRGRYFTREFHELEMAQLWSRVWQMACHVSQIPEVGDHVVYDIGDDSLLVTRAAAGEVRAFHNTCLHRGNCLRAEDGAAEQFRCSFHGWTWALDGRFVGGPCEWDFPGTRSEELRLPEAHVALWAGWVFVNLAPDPEPFDSYRENLDELAEGFRFDERTISLHLQKTVDGNWKTCMEAFIESYHVSLAHPQITAFSGDYQSQYDVYPGVRHVSRMIVPYGIPSPSFEGDVDTAQVLRQVMGEAAPDEPGDESVRAHVSRFKRAVYSERSGVDLSGRSDSEIVDAIELFLFPNFVPWLGTGQPYVYRFRPAGHDPDTCVMDVYVMQPSDAPHRRRAPETVRLGRHEPWSAAPGVATIGTVLDQDMPNVAGVQRGIRAGRTPTVRLASYQESRIRHFHRTLDSYLGSG